MMERCQSAGGMSTWWGWGLEDKPEEQHQRREERAQRGEVPTDLRTGGGEPGVRL